MTDFPLPIVTPRLLLRKPIVGRDDICDYVKAVTESIDDLKPWLPWARNIPTLNQAEAYVRACYSNWITKNNNSVGLPLWIVDRVTGEFVGHIVMWNIVWSVPKLEIGFWVRSSCSRNGYMTEAVNALTRYCFLQLGVQRLEIRCEAKNARCQLISKRLGFQLDGTFRNNTVAVSDGSLSDTLIFSRVDLTNLPDLDVCW